MSDIRELVENRARLWEQSKELHERAKDGVMSAEDRQQWDRLQDEIDKLGDRIDRELRLKRLDQVMSQPLIGPQSTVATGDNAPTEERAFRPFLKGKLTPEVRAALQEGTDSEGGYLVPTLMANQLETGLKTASIFRAVGAQVKPISSLRMNVPRLSNTGAAVLTGEEAAFNEAEPTLEQVAVVVYKYTRLAKASQEVMADSKFDIWNDLLLPDFQQAFAKAENAAFISGTGSGQPEGVLTGGTVAVTTASGSAITADEVIDLVYSLDYRLERNARIMAAKSVFKAIRKLKDSQGQYLWQPGLGGQPDTLLGYPIVKNDDMPAIALNAKVMVIGDFSYYWIFDRNDLAVQRLVELYATSGQVGFIGYKRFDGHVMLPTAFQILKMAAA